MSWFKSPPPSSAKAGSWRAGSLDDARRSLQDRLPNSGADLETVAPPPPDPEEEARKARAAGYEEGLAQGRERGLSEGRQKGHEEGFQQGHGEGVSSARAEHEAALSQIRQEEAEALAKVRTDFEDSLRKFINDAYGAIREWKEESSQAHTHLGLEIARRAVMQELKLSRDSALALAKEALAELHQGVEFRILVNPADVAVVEGHRQEITEIFSHIRGLEVVPDRSIHAGVVVETQSGTIDARIEAYLQRMAEAALREREAA
jgi:flagellar assembly protein FliH